MYQKLKFDDLFRISDYIYTIYRIQEMAFKPCTQQSGGGKSQEDKQLKFAPQ